MTLILILAIIALFEILFELFTNWAHERKYALRMHRIASNDSFAVPSNIFQGPRKEKKNHTQRVKLLCQTYRETKERTKNRIVLITGVIAGYFLTITLVSIYVLTTYNR